MGEQAFERSLETVVEAMDASDLHYPEPVLKAALASFIVILVLPAWRIWILRTTLQALLGEGGRHGLCQRVSSIFRLSDFPRFSEDLVEAYLHDQEIELVDSVLCGGVVTRLVKGVFSPREPF